MNTNLKTTLTAWPAITLIAVALCVLTQTAAECFGIELPDQANVKAVRNLLTNAFTDMRHFLAAANVVAMVLIIMPVVEEAVFRKLGFGLGSGKLPAAAMPVRAVLSSALFSAAHYLQQPFPDNAFAALFFFGLAQCWLYRKTQRIVYPMLNHLLFNLTNLLLMFVVPRT